MATPRVDAGGGLPAMFYVFKKAREAGGLRALLSRLHSKNTCKTCALGMGGQRGGMIDESGHYPSVCKKSIQAVAGDMGATIDGSFFSRTSIEDMGRMTPAELERQGRLGFPIIAGPEDTHYRPISWDEALDHSGDAFAAAPPERTFFYASGRSSNEAAFLLQLVVRAFGSPHINNCSFYCHQASGVALSKVYGSGTASVVLEDLEEADLAMVVGANPASNHPRLITQLMELRRRGGKVIVINPLKELGMVRFRVPSDARSLLLGSDISDLYLQPHVGADIPLLMALLKGLVERGAIDRDYIASYTTGFEAVADEIERSSWIELLEACGTSRAQVDEAVTLLAEAKRGVFLWAMGLTHHGHGVDNILALANLALARGWLGRPGRGLLPIRGHSNVQGVGSVGVAPSMKAAFAKRMEELYGIVAPATAGWDTFACMQAAAAGEVDAAFLLGGNLLGSNPDTAWASAALSRIPMLVTASTKLNTGHALGRGRTSIVLPVLTRDEERQPTSQESMFNFVRLSSGGERSVDGDLRSEVEVIAALASRILPEGRFDWAQFTSHAHLRQQIAKVVGGYERIGDLDQTRAEFQIAGRTFHEPRFATDDGKAYFHVTPPSRFEVDPGEFRLMTLRSEGQFNSVVYEEEDLYRGMTRRDVVMMAAEDLYRLGLREGDRVVVGSEAGQLEVSAFAVDIPSGNAAMYYPEANVLVPRRLDPRSKTPAFKSVAATITPLAATLQSSEPESRSDSSSRSETPSR